MDSLDADPRRVLGRGPLVEDRLPVPRPELDRAWRPRVRVQVQIPHAYMAVLVGATLAAAVAASLLPAASAARSSVIPNLQAE